MKLGIFTDPHYSTAAITCGNRYNSRSLVKIEKAMACFAAENCDLVICLGDFIDKEPTHAQEVTNLQKAAAVINSSPVKTAVLMGNHDAFAFTPQEFYQILGEEHRPCDIHTADKHLIFLDACWLKSGVHYQPGDDDWTDTFLPNADALRQTLSTLQGDVYLFLHQNVDPAISSDHRLYNAAEVFAIAAESGNVRAVYQGHYHPGKRSIYGGIEYITFAAMCENEDAFYTVTV